MITQEIDFKAPKQLAEALGLLKQHGDNAKVLAGGMSLVPMMTLGLAQPEIIISLNHVAGLSYIREAGNMLLIGAMTSHDTVRTDPLVKRFCPILAEAASYVGDVQVRHRGTIGGSLAHADPAADYPPAMLILGAQLRLQSASGERIAKAQGFFKDLMQTDLAPDELVVEIQLPKMIDGAGYSYQRLHRVEGNFAIVNAAAVVGKSFKAARLALGGVGPRPVMLDVSGHLANGLTDTAVKAVGEEAYAVSAEAYSDINGDAAYRREMARVYALRVIKTAASQAG